MHPVTAWNSMKTCGKRMESQRSRLLECCTAMRDGEGGGRGGPYAVELHGSAANQATVDIQMMQHGRKQKESSGNPVCKHLRPPRILELLNQEGSHRWLNQRLKQPITKAPDTSSHGQRWLSTGQASRKKKINAEYSVWVKAPSDSKKMTVSVWIVYLQRHLCRLKQYQPHLYGRILNKENSKQCLFTRLVPFILFYSSSPAISSNKYHDLSSSIHIYPLLSIMNLRWNAWA